MTPRRVDLCYSSLRSVALARRRIRRVVTSDRVRLPYLGRTQASDTEGTVRPVSTGDAAVFRPPRADGHAAADSSLSPVRP